MGFESTFWDILTLVFHALDCHGLCGKADTLHVGWGSLGACWQGNVLLGNLSGRKDLTLDRNNLRITSSGFHMCHFSLLLDCPFTGNGALSLYDRWLVLVSLLYACCVPTSTEANSHVMNLALDALVCEFLGCIDEDYCVLFDVRLLMGELFHQLPCWWFGWCLSRHSAFHRAKMIPRHANRRLSHRRSCTTCTYDTIGWMVDHVWFSFSKLHRLLTRFSSDWFVLRLTSWALACRSVLRHLFSLSRWLRCVGTIRSCCIRWFYWEIVRCWMICRLLQNLQWHIGIMLEFGVPCWVGNWLILWVLFAIVGDKLRVVRVRLRVLRIVRVLTNVMVCTLTD